MTSEPALYKFRIVGGDAIERRATFRRLAAEGPQLRRIPGDEEVITRDFTVSARDSHEILVRSYAPKGFETDGTPYPLLIYYHGGGWTSGDLETGDDNCRFLCHRNRLSVLNVDYRLAPEHVFPTGINDAYDVFKWATENSTEALHADLEQGFIVGGVSAGANMAGVIAYLARDDKIMPPITGLLLSVPCCLMPPAFDLVPQWQDELLSIEQNKNSDLLDLNSYNQLIQGANTHSNSCAT